MKGLIVLVIAAKLWASGGTILAPGGGGTAIGYPSGGEADYGDLVLEYLFGTDENPTPDTSGQDNDGYQGAITYVSATNGLSAHQTWTTSSVTTSTVTEAQATYSWWANTNSVWRFYESMNGTNFTDLTADTWVASNFFTVSGDVITWGGLACGGDFDEIRAYTNVAMTYSERLATNIQQAAYLGILDDYFADNTNLLFSSVALAATLNNQLQYWSGAGWPLFTTGSSPTPFNVQVSPANGAYDFNGGANYVEVPDTNQFCMVNGLTNQSVCMWINIDSDGGGNVGYLFGKKEYTGVRGGGLYCYAAGDDGTSVPIAVRVDRATDAVAVLNTETLLNTWVHLAIVYNAENDNRIDVYTNAVLASLGTDTAGSGAYNNDNLVPFRLGNDSTGNRGFDGSIDIPILFTNSISPETITNIYNAQVGLFP